MLPQQSLMKYYCMILNKNIKFLDSYQFLKASLSSLIHQHALQNEFKFLDELLTSKYNIQKSSRLYKLLTGQKGCFPFDHVDTFDKLKETVFPSQVQFYDHLNEKSVSDKNYEKNCYIYNESNCKNLGEYMQLYCLTDVGFLADIVLSWRKGMFSEYFLDPCQYITICSFSLDSFLYKKYMENPQFKLDLIYEPELNDLIISNIRGGFTTLISHHEKAVNSAVSNLDFTNQDPNSFNLDIKKTDQNKIIMSDIMYFDINSNYSAAMSYKLPTGNFNKFNDHEQIFRWLKNPKKNFQSSNTGYFIEVTFTANDDRLQDKTDQYPLAIENKKIMYDDISDYTKSRLSSGIPKSFSFKRLIGHHNKKDRQVYSADLLHYYVQMGMNIETIHSVYSFSQEAFLKKHVEDTIKKRSATCCPIMSAMHKLFLNSLFGKFLSNPINYDKNVYLCTNKERFLNKLCNQNFMGLNILSKNKVLMSFRKPKVKLKVPIYIGFVILELSRLINYEIFYNDLMTVYKVNYPRLIYADTDSFILKIHLFFNLKTKIEDLKKQFFNKRNKLLRKLKNRNRLDTSNMHYKHELFDSATKGKLALLKNELPKSYVSEIIALSPKNYAILLFYYHTETTIKNIQNNIQQLTKKTDVIKSLYTDLESGIFYINSSNTGFTTKSIVYHCTQYPFQFEEYHTVKMQFIHEDIETILENENSDDSVRLPYAKSFYNDHLLPGITSKIVNLNIDNIYYFEIDSKYDVYIYKYASNDHSRPEPRHIFNTEFHKTIAKTRATAGIPYRIAEKLHFMDYRDALDKTRDEILRIKYHSMQNVRGTFKTITVEKNALSHNCIKRYFTSINKSYSYGHYKINKSNTNEKNTHFENYILSSSSDDDDSVIYDSNYADIEYNTLTQKDQFVQPVISHMFPNRLEKYRDKVFFSENVNLDVSNANTESVSSDTVNLSSTPAWNINDLTVTASTSYNNDDDDNYTNETSSTNPKIIKKKKRSKTKTFFDTEADCSDKDSESEKSDNYESNDEFIDDKSIDSRDDDMYDFYCQVYNS